MISIRARHLNSATILVSAVSLAPGQLTRVPTVALFLGLLVWRTQERQTKDEATIAELREQLTALGEHLDSTTTLNRALVEECEGLRKSRSVTLECIHTLSKELSEVRETMAQHEATIADLDAHSIVLKATMGEQQKQMDYASQKAASNIFDLQQELKQKAKEAEDWKDMYRYHLNHGAAPASRRYIHHAQTANQPRLGDMLDLGSLSLTGIIAAKDQEVEELKDRLAECHSQLTLCSCPKSNGALLGEMELQAQYNASQDTPCGRGTSRLLTLNLRSLPPTLSI